MAVCWRMFQFVLRRNATVLSGSRYLCCRTVATTSFQKANDTEGRGHNTHSQYNSHERYTQESSQSRSEESEYEHEVRQRILLASLRHVHEHGWTRKALEAGARDEGLPSVAHGMFSRGGVELIHFFNVKSNSELVNILKQEVETEKTLGLAKPVTKPFIRKAVETRLRMVGPYLETWPQAMAILALPPNVSEAFSNLLKLSDDIWFYAGDRSVDFNWYTKRLSLATIYAATETYMIQDKSPDQQNTWSFLDNRIEELHKCGAAKNSWQQTGGVLKGVLLGFSIMVMGVTVWLLLTTDLIYLIPLIFLIGFSIMLMAVFALPMLVLTASLICCIPFIFLIFLTFYLIFGED